MLDEINLASADTLECLTGLLESSSGSVTLHEKGDSKPVERHPNFRLFACMNPATDVGKKELPIGLRNRFTEVFMDEFRSKEDLKQLVKDYLAEVCLSNLIMKSTFLIITKSHFVSWKMLIFFFL